MKKINNILLINPPMCVDTIPKFLSFGIAYIEQELKRNHYDVEILDIDGNRFCKEEVSEFIKKSNADLIGIGGLVTIYPYLDWLIPEIRKRKPEIEIILGGAIASSLRERCFERFDIDIEVIGEGEVTIIELIKELNGNRNLASVRGIGFRDNGKIIFTEKRPLMESLEGIPIIDYSPFPQEKLLRNSQRVLQIHVQRGCPMSCTFCFNCYRVVSNKIRYRPVNHVIDEIEFFKGKYEVDFFALSGECVLLNKKWIIDFCQEILRRRLKIKYRVTSRADTVDEEKLRWLKKSGCVRMSLGLETGSPRIMEIMKKGITVAQAKRSARMAERYIPKIEVSIMLGYIGEDENTLEETVKFVKDIGIRPALFYATAFPGTELYRMALAKGRIKNEEEYMMSLDKSSIFNLSLNLTDMPDDIMQRRIASAIDEINRYFFYKDLINLKLFAKLFSHISLCYRKNGFNKTVIKMLDVIIKGIGQPAIFYKHGA